ncbi:hypothetical protein [Bradyrhizobium sp. USDA 336]|uniref:hypothetical protein n=1 Tax=Bradyrhizobium sp. USDA 336 TaxID=3156311 RepID=UPI003834E164
MNSKNAVIIPTQAKIVSRIETVRKAWDRSVSRGGKFSEYKYLRAVFRAYEVFASNDLLDSLAEIAPCELMSPVRSSWHPIRTIIEATCDKQDVRMKSRWTRAMEFALTRKVASSDLLRFIRANGGIAGCADLASKLKLNRRSDHVSPQQAPVRDGAPLRRSGL